MKLVFATNNTHKLEEVRKILPSVFQVISLQELGCNEDIAETDTTLEANSLIKAQYVWDHYHVDCFADDTGLEIEALNGAPGVYTARWAGEAHNDAANRAKALRELQGIDNRRARFRTVITLIRNGQVRQVEGIVEGEIAMQESGENGFGYDPIFIPKGHLHTFSELPSEIKNTISHRAKAMAQLKHILL